MPRGAILAQITNVLFRGGLPMSTRWLMLLDRRTEWLTACRASDIAARTECELRVSMKAGQSAAECYKERLTRTPALRTIPSRFALSLASFRRRYRGHGPKARAYFHNSRLPAALSARHCHRRLSAHDRYCALWVAGGQRPGAMRACPTQR